MPTALYAPPVSRSKSEWITRQQAAEVLGLSLASVDRYVRRGAIEMRKGLHTKRVTLSADDVERLRRELAEERLPE